MKKKIIFTLILLIVSVGIVSASENITTDIADGSNDIIAIEDDSNSKINSDYDDITDFDGYDDESEVEIIASSQTKTYNSNNKINVKLKYLYDDSYVQADELHYQFDSQKQKTLRECKYTNGVLVYEIPCNLQPGTHTLKLSISDSYYKATPKTITITINKLNPTVKAVHHETTGKYVVLKATVKYKGKNINEGKIKFKINGKRYGVDVKKGIAVKKIKIKNGYHHYTATFTSSKYTTKTSSNTVIKGKKYYTFKAKGVEKGTYTVKVPFKQYLKLIKAREGGYHTYFTIDTGKKEKFVSSKDIYKTKTVYETKKIRVLDYEEYWDYGTSYSYSTTKYYDKGWTYVGGEGKTYSDGYEHYSIFKKKVKTTKKVYVSTENTYSSKSYPLKCHIGINENGKLSCRWDITRESQLKANLIIPHWNGKL